MSVRKMQGRILLDPFDRGTLKAHLLMNGFMDGYTPWISEEDDGDDEGVHMAGNNDMGLYNLEAHYHYDLYNHISESMVVLLYICCCISAKYLLASM